MTTLRDDIRTITYKRTSEMLDNPDENGIYPTATFYDAMENDILALIRERLLSDEAITAAAAKWWEYSDSTIAPPKRWHERNEHAQNHGRMIVKPILEDALDAIMEND